MRRFFLLLMLLALPALAQQHGSGIRNGYTVNNGTTNTVIRPQTGFVFYTTAAQRSIASSSASDKTGSTGAITVQLTYCDGNMLCGKTDTVTLNGTLAVNTNVTDIQFVERMDVMSVGTNGANVGAVSIFSLVNGGGGSFVCIAVGDNASFFAHHFVSASSATQILGLNCSASAQAGTVTIASQGDPRVTNVVQVNQGVFRHGTTNTMRQFEVPLTVTGPNFIIVQEQPDAATISGSNTVRCALDYQDQ